MTTELGIVLKGNGAQLKSTLVDSGAAVTQFGEQAEKYLQKGEMSAKQMAFATRGIPAQFTDIAVSLQAGQNPLTVFLQQGGQLKDMFGGVGPAAKAMGGYLMGLINPYTLAAAGAAALGYVWYQGAKQGGEFTKAIILSGNAAGITAAQMQGAARAIGASSNVSVGAAADVVTQFTRSGDVAVGKIQEFAGVAASMQKITGVAVADTVKQFSELAKDPVAASLKLNEQTNYLTTSVYQQIKALSDQNRMHEAGALAQQAWADAMNSRMPQIEANLLKIEKWWNAVAKAVKNGWASMIAPADPAQEIRDEIKRLTDHPAYDMVAQAAVDREVAALKQKLSYYDHVAASDRDHAAFQAGQAKQLEATVAWDKIHDQYLSKATEKTRELGKLSVAYLALTPEQRTGGAEEYLKSYAAIEKKFKEPDTKKHEKPDPWGADVLAKYVKTMDDLAKIQSAASARVEELSKSQTYLRDIMASPEWAAFNRQQREQLIYATSLAQVQEDIAKSKAEELRVSSFINKAERDSTNKNEKAVDAIFTSLQTPFEKEREEYAKRLTELTIFNAARRDGEAGVNLLIEQEKKRHTDAVQSMQASYDMKALSMMSSNADQLYGILQKSGKDQGALGKAVFLASKAIAVAQIIMNTEVAAAAAIKDGAMFSIFGIPTGIALATMIRATGYASAGMTAGLAIDGVREQGGPVWPGGAFMVGEKGPEIFRPSSSGSIIPNHQIGNAGPVINFKVINNSSTKLANPSVNKESNGDYSVLLQDAVAATAAAMSDPNSKTSRAMQRNFALQRSRA